jgi:hypothetical protein
MRFIAIAALTVASGVAVADAPATFRLLEDGVLGTTFSADHPLVNVVPASAAVSACLGKTVATGSAVVWLELDKKGRVTTAKVRGSGVVALDTCLSAALKRAAATDKPPGPIVVVGHLDMADVAKADHVEFLPSPRISTVAVMVDPRGASWQLAAKRIGYTANRASDISQAMDGQADAIAACTTKRGAKLAAANMVAWSDGKAIVRGSGDAAYDACLGKALGGIKLPAPESAMWMELELRKPGEPLAPKGTTHDQAVREALHDAVSSKKAALAECLDNQPTAKLGKILVTLKGEKVSVKTVATGVTSVDACVKAKLETTVVKNASATDIAAVEVAFD